LIVDDERDVAMLLQHYLEQQGYEIEQIYSGSEALTRIFRGGFDLVLMDHDMKGIKGDRICLLMRADDKLRTLPVVIITAHIEVGELEFKEYGANAVLYKPVDSGELIATVKKCLNEI
jgi:CheY-like chemotaxis protein